MQARLSTATSVLSAFGNRALSQIRLQGLAGQLCACLLPGVLWAPCVGPTLGAASTLAAQRRDLPRAALVMVLFGAGAMLPLLVLGAVSRAVLLCYRRQLLAVGRAGKKPLWV
jgi:cytochrome c-type biogenesis protein